jgi:aspartate 1-decarboxylase
MLRCFCRAKIHQARVTEARLDYEGSVTVDAALLEAAGILPYELVQITNDATGARWRTYVMVGAAGSGTICLNGPPARWFQPGDRVVILCSAYLSPDEIDRHEVRLVFVDEDNRPVRTEVHAVGRAEPPAPFAAQP